VLILLLRGGGEGERARPPGRRGAQYRRGVRWRAGPW